MRVDRLRALPPVVALAVLAGCAGGSAAAPPAPTPQFPPVPRPDPVEVCTDQLTHWAGEQLRGAPDIGYDYQHMALSAEQALALRELVDEARAGGGALPADQLRARARERCAGLPPDGAY